MRRREIINNGKEMKKWKRREKSMKIKVEKKGKARKKKITSEKK